MNLSKHYLRVCKRADSVYLTMKIQISTSWITAFGFHKGRMTTSSTQSCKQLLLKKIKCKTFCYNLNFSGNLILVSLEIQFARNYHKIKPLNCKERQPKTWEIPCSRAMKMRSLRSLKLPTKILKKVWLRFKRNLFSESKKMIQQTLN